MRLAKDWRHAPRWYSVQAQGLALTLVVAWQAVPDDLRASAPGWLATTLLVAILALGIAGRLVDQDAEPHDD